MKKLLFTLIALFSFAVAPNYANNNEETVLQTTLDTFEKVEIKDLPTAITDLITNEYENYTIEEAFLKEEQGSKVYKLILKGEEGNITILCDEEGKLIEDKEPLVVVEEEEENEIMDKDWD